DGNDAGTFDAYNSSEVSQQVLWSTSGLAYGPHAVRIAIGDYPNPDRNPSSSDTYQALDAYQTDGFALRLDPVLSRTQMQQSGNWNCGSGEGYDYCYSNEAGAALSYTFTGTGVEVFAHREAEQGYMNILIDGAEVASVDTYGPLPDSYCSDCENLQNLY